MSQARFSVRTAVAEGFEFWRANVLKAIGPLAIAAVASLVGAVAPEQFALAASGLNFIALIVAQGALFRIALASEGAESPDRNGPFGLQWRGLETRLLGMTFGLVLLLFAVAIAATFALALVVVAMVGDPAALNVSSPEAFVASLTPQAAFVFNFGMTLCLLGILILVMRLPMAAPATAATNRVRLFSSLGMTRGSVIRILGAVLIVNLPVFALQGLALGYTKLIGAAATDRWAESVAAAITTFFYVPISVGMTSYIYRRLREGGGQ